MHAVCMPWFLIWGVYLPCCVEQSHILPIIASHCAPIVFPTFLHCFSPDPYIRRVLPHSAGAPIKSHTATRIKHTPAFRPIFPSPSKKQVDISSSHHSGRQRLNDGILIPIIKPKCCLLLVGCLSEVFLNNLENNEGAVYISRLNPELC